MKNYILILLMVVTVMLSGCGEGTEHQKTSGNSLQQSTQDVDVVEKDPDIGKHKVNVYLFHSSGCGHCREEKTWIASIKDKYSYVNFIMYEVSEYPELFAKVSQAYDVDNEYVPVTIIGNNYMVGYSETKNRKFIRYFEELSTFESCDVVQAVIDGDDVEACMAKNEIN